MPVFICGSLVSKVLNICHLNSAPLAYYPAFFFVLRKTNPLPVKKFALCLLVLAFLHPAHSQQSTKTPLYSDSLGALVEQKEKIINAETILKVENLGTTINTRLPELRPTISADGNLLFFICQNHPDNTKYNEVPNSQDIWFSERDSAGKWGEAVHLGYPLNTYYYNAVF